MAPGPPGSESCSTKTLFHGVWSAAFLAELLSVQAKCMNDYKYGLRDGNARILTSGLTSDSFGIRNENETTSHAAR